MPVMEGRHQDDEQHPYRTGLGEYVPEPGGQPLTALARPLPGPADYELPPLNDHKPAPPDYTIRNRYPNMTANQQDWPCPNTYQPQQPGGRARLLTTLKPKIEPPDYRCSPGPAHLVRTGNVDTKPGRTTIKSRHTARATTGLPCPIDRTCYTRVPAPKYAPVVAHLPRAARFLLNERPPRDDDTLGPGPGSRNTRRALSGPSYTLRQRSVQPNVGMDNPPPDWYFVQDMLPAVHAPKMGQLIKPRHRSPIPAPNAYKVPRRPLRAPEMTFRPFESKPTFQTPGPGAYSPEVSPRRRLPAYSIRLPVRAAYPSQDRPAYGRGPATYNTRGEPARKPAFKLTVRPKTTPNGNPAPNAYSPHGAPGTNKGFTLRIKPKDLKRPKVPAPNKYLPPKPLPRAPEYSLHIRHRNMAYKEKGSVPAPDAYVPSMDCGCGVHRYTVPGVSMKSRPSVYLYTGYDRARVPHGMSPKADTVRNPIS